MQSPCASGADREYRPTSHLQNTSGVLEMQGLSASKARSGADSDNGPKSPYIMDMSFEGCFGRVRNVEP